MIRRIAIYLYAALALAALVAVCGRFVPADAATANQGCRYVGGWGIECENSTTPNQAIPSGTATPLTWYVQAPPPVVANEVCAQSVHVHMSLTGGAACEAGQCDCDIRQYYPGTLRSGSYVRGDGVAAAQPEDSFCGFDASIALGLNGSSVPTITATCPGCLAYGTDSLSYLLPLADAGSGITDSGVDSGADSGADSGSDAGGGPILAYDTRALAPGVVTPPSWLSFARATANTTVQTSATTFATGIAANAAVVMSDGVAQGLLLEEAWSHWLIQDTALNTTPWTGASATLTTGQTDPAGGTTAMRVVATGSQQSTYQLMTVPTSTCMMSMWAKGTSASQTFTPGYANTPSVGPSTTATTSWTRFDFKAIATDNQPFCVPIFESSCDVTIAAPDYYNNTAGSTYPASYFPTTTGSVGVSYPVAGTELKVLHSVSSPVNAGSLNPHILFVADGALSEYGGAMRVLTDTANASTNYVEFSTAGAITIKWNGVTVTPSTAITFTRGASIQLNISIGTGTTSVSWSINGGGAVVQTGASVGTITATDLDVLSNGTGSQFGSRLQLLQFY